MRRARSRASYVLQRMKRPRVNISYFLGRDEAGARRTAGELLKLQPDLRVSTWLKSSPGADFEMGRHAARMLRSVGVPD